ncbi:MAG: hypothetical protein WCP28_02835 [Actinomycetes bacterium]
MSRSTRTAVVRRFVHSQTTVTVVAAATAGALVVGLMAAGASSAIAAAPDYHSALDSTLYPQTVAPAGTENAPSSDGLKVTVGKAVSITTDAAGKPGPIVQLVTNTQVSGNGSGTVTIPVGTDHVTNQTKLGTVPTSNKSMIYNVSSNSGQVQNLLASAGTYSGPQAVSLEVQTWVDGQSVNPGDMTNVTGNVKINYVLTNNTAVDTPITYKNASGETVHETVPVPVPMGASFMTVLGNGWANVDAPWANTGISPTGQELTGTAILFPPLGSSKVTLSVTARAEHASLPSSTTTAVPIDLSTLAKGALPVLTNQGSLAVADINGILGPLPSDLLTYQNLLAQFAQLIGELDAKTVQPMVNKINDVQVPTKLLNTAVVAASKGVGLAGDYLELSGLLAKVDAIAAGAAADLSRKAGASLPAAAKKMDALAAALTEMTKPDGKLVKTLVEIEDVIAKLGTLAPEVSGLLFPVKSSCPYLATTNGATANAQSALANAIAGGSALGPLQTNLNKQAAAASVVPLPPGTDPIVATNAALANCAKDVQAIVTLFSSMGNIDDSPIAKAIRELIFGLQELGTTKIPAAAAKINQLGVNIEDHAATFDHVQLLLRQVSAADATAGAAFKEVLAPAVFSLKNYITPLQKLLGVVQHLATMLGGAVAQAPSILDKFAADLGGLGALALKASDITGGMTNKLAVLNASMQTMVSKAAAGDAVPYGNATGTDGNVQTLAAWQINQVPAGNFGKDGAINFGIALLMFLIAGGIGTAMYVRNKPIPE